MLPALLLALLPVRTDPRALVRDLPRGRPAVLHFFASWCGACRDEFPRLRGALGDLAASASVELVSIDTAEDAPKAEEMLREYGLAQLPALRLEAPSPDPVARAVGDRRWDGTLPATFVFDPRGRLAKSFRGRVSPRALRAAVAAAARAKPR